MIESGQILQVATEGSLEDVKIIFFCIGARNNPQSSNILQESFITLNFVDFDEVPDSMSTENAMILTHCIKWPLMVDPQLQVHLLAF